MKNKLENTITSAVLRLLRPLVRILLRNGIPHGTFSELAKWVYTDVASREFGIKGRKQTVSRVAILTGLTRKEVKRLREIPSMRDVVHAERYHRAARVIGGWLKDPRFTDESKQPRELPMDDPQDGFAALVKAYSGDIPVRAILDELERVGVVEKEKEEGTVRLLSRGYVPKTGRLEKIHILGEDAHDLMASIDHNLVQPPSEAFLQRKVFYDNIPKSKMKDMRDELFKLGEAFIQRVDRVISSYDRDANPSVKGKGRSSASLGVFYFEEQEIPGEKK